MNKDISSKIRISKLSSLKFVACMSKLYKNIQIWKSPRFVRAVISPTRFNFNVFNVIIPHMYVMKKWNPTLCQIRSGPFEF
jgi:hypothetical protein